MIDTKTLKSFEHFVVLAVIFALPLFFAPISTNLFITAKLALLFFGILAVLVSKTLRLLTTNKLKFTSGKLDLAMVLLGFGVIASTIWAMPAKIEALLLPGTATYTLGGILLYFLVVQLPDKERAKIPHLLTLSGAISALVLILAYSGLFSTSLFSFLPSYLQSKYFNLLGGYMPTAIFLAMCVPLVLSNLTSAKKVAQKVLYGTKLAVIALALAISVFTMTRGVPGSEQSTKLSLPSFGTSWNILVDTLQANPLLGVGVGNYQTAFNRYRPLAYNQTSIWNTKFATANNYFFTAITETGLVGTFGFVLLALAFARMIHTHLGLAKDKNSSVSLAEKTVFWTTVLLVVLLAFLPGSAVTIVLLFVMLGLISTGNKLAIDLAGQTKDLTANSKDSRLFSVLVGLPVLVFCLFAGYKGQSVLAAEYKFKKALDAASANNGQQAYTLMAQAITQNPRAGQYHASFAQLNLLLASNLAQRPSGEKDEFTDTDRSNISQLIQEAVAQAKAVVATNPSRSENWELLASIYRAIMPLAQGADQYAVQTYSQAVALDPLNTNLRINLGGLLYGAGAYDDAVSVFQLAVSTKPDYANAHYNLALAYKGAGKLQQAVNEMTTVLSLVDANSKDFETAKDALDSLQTELDSGKKSSEQAASGDELNAPQPTEEPVLDPPLDLPEDSQPPKPEETAAPSPTPTASAAPTPTPLP